MQRYLYGLNSSFYLGILFYVKFKNNAEIERSKLSTVVECLGPNKLSSTQQYVIDNDESTSKTNIQHESPMVHTCTQTNSTMLQNLTSAAHKV